MLQVWELQSMEIFDHHLLLSCILVRNTLFPSASAGGCCVISVSTELLRQ